MSKPMDRKTKATIAGCLNIFGSVGLLTTAVVTFNESPFVLIMIFLCAPALTIGTSLTTALKYEAVQDAKDEA